MSNNADIELRIVDSFETLTQDEWDKFLDVDFFENMYIKEVLLPRLLYHGSVLVGW